MSKKILFLLCLCLSVGFGFEINGDGSPVDFSKIGLSSRYWGMGKSGVAFANDSGGFLLNPASLGTLRSFECSAMNTKVLGEFNYSLINGVFPLQNETIGLSLLNEDAGTIYSSDSVDQYGHPIQGDTVENYTRLFSFGYGRKAFFDELYLGTAVKVMQKKISFVEGRSIAVDVGALYRFNKNINFGLTVKNLVQNGVVYSNSAAAVEPMDPDYIFGVAWSLFDRNLVIGLDQHTNTEFGRTNLGAEYWLADMVALRCGIAEKDTTFGAGFRYDAFQIDFALRYQEAPLENQVFVSLTYGDARRSNVARPEIEIAEEPVQTKAPETKPQSNNQLTPLPVKNTNNAPVSYSQPEEIQVVD